MFRSKSGKRAARERRRRESFRSDAWRHDSSVASRRYGGYDEYVEHQRAKLGGIIERLQRREAGDLGVFVELFTTCEALRDARTVLCLGARLGTEVKALHQLGRFAVGIDLNPGPENHHVLPGDFHALVFPDASVDAVYTNALDHAFELDRVLAEVSRVLRPGGVFIVDLVQGFDEGYLPGDYEAMHWSEASEFARQLAEIGRFETVSERDLAGIGREKWIQVVLRKPDGAR